MTALCGRDSVIDQLMYSVQKNALEHIITRSVRPTPRQKKKNRTLFNHYGSNKQTYTKLTKHSLSLTDGLPQHPMMTV